MTSQVKVRFLADTTGMQKGVKSAQSQLSGFQQAMGPMQKSFNGIGSSMLAAFSPQNLASGPGAAVTAGLAVIATYKEVAETMVKASKSYFEDQQSIMKMDVALVRNTNLTNEQIHAYDAQIDKLSILTTFQDDDLRQSYANIVASTKDAKASMDLLTIATDVSAGSGLSLEKVSKALTKAYQGNSGALQKLLPGVKQGKEGINELADAYKGAGKAVGDASPFERMQIAMDQLNEILGSVLAPLITQFSDWLASDDFQNLTKYLVNLARTVSVSIILMVQPIFDFFNWLFSPAMINAFTSVMSALGVPIDVLNKSFKDAGKAMNDNPLVKSINETADAVLDSTRKLKGFKFGDIGGEGNKPAEIAQRIKDGAAKIKDAGKKFAESINFGQFLNQDTNIFDANAFMEKFRGIVAAAKALPAKLKALRKAGASPEVLQQIVAMGPEQGLAVAQGFLSNAGSAKEYSKSLSTLNTLGQQAMGNAAGTSNYTINLNKSNMTAEEIITAIQKYERKTGKKVAF